MQKGRYETADLNNKEAMKKAVLSYGAIYNSIAIGIGIFDENLILVDCNLMFQTIFGVEDKQEWINFHPSICKDPNFSSDFIEKIQSNSDKTFLADYDFDRMAASGLFKTTNKGRKIFEIRTSALIDVDNIQIGYVLTVLDVTATKRQEMIQQTINNNIPVGIELYDKEGKLVYLNGVDLKNFGVESAEEIVGINLFDDPNTPNDINERIRAGEDIDYEIEYNFALSKKSHYFNTTSTGKRFFSVKSVTIRNDYNEIEGYMLTSIDITQRRMRERKERELKTSLELILNAGEISVWRYDIKKRKFSAMLGSILMPDGSTYEDCANLMDDESKAAYHRAISNLMNGVTDHENCLFHFLLPQTEYGVYYRDEMAVLFDDKGERIAIVGTQKDVTADNVQKQKLEEFKIRTNLTNEKNRIIQWEYNSLKQHFTTEGYERNTEGLILDKENLLAQVYPEDRYMAEDFINKLSQGDADDLDLILRCYLPNCKEYRYIVLNAVQIKNAKGFVMSYTGICRDITEETLQRKELANKTYKTALITQASGLVPWEYDCNKKIFISDDNIRAGKELTLEDYLEFVVGRDREKLEQVWSILRECKNKSFSLDIKYRYLDTWMYATLAGDPYEIDANGKVVRYLGFRKDTTDIVLMNKDVSESKIKTELAIKKAKMVMWEYDVDEKMFTAFNDPLTNYDITLKYSPEDFIAHVDFDSIGEIKRVLASMDRQELGEFTFNTKIKYENTDSWQYITVYGSHLEVCKDNPSKATKYIGFRVNNTELVTLSQGLEDSNSLTYSILAQIPSAVFIKDITNDWRYILGNNLFCQFVSCTEEQIIEHTDFEIFDYLVAEKFRSDDLKAIEYGDIYSFIEEIETGGVVKALHTTKKVITTSNGRQLLIGISSDITATIEQQKALELANQKSELILNNANAGFMYVDKEFKVIWENAESSKNSLHICKCKLGEKCYSTIYGLSSPCPYCAITRAQKSLKIEKVREKFADGVVLDFFATPVFDDNRQVNGYVCRIDDVTEDVLITKKLEDTQKYLDLAIAAGHVAVWGYNIQEDKVFNLSGRVFNQDIISFSEAVKYVHKDDLALFMEAWQRVLKGESKSDLICFRFISPFTGELEYVDVNMLALPAPSGELEMIIGTLHNVTETELQKQALKKSNQQKEESNMLLNSIIKQIPFGLFIKEVENDFRYVVMNDILANINGIDAKSAIGKSDYELFEKQIADKFYKESLHAAKLPDGVLSVVENHIDWHGHKYIYEDSNTVITVGNGRRLLIGVVADVTDKYQIMSELQYAKERAEQSDKLKSAFLANMSHEIRTPLNAIVGFSDLLIETDDANDRKEYANIITENNELLIRLIGDILDLSKIESGMVEFLAEKFDISEVCNDVYTMLNHKITNPNIQFLINNPYKTCMVELDKNRLKQVWINFITNAIKYTDKGTIIMTYEYVENGLKISVKDTGIGIAKEHHSKVFKRFEKFDSFAQGTGLGLSICKAIVDAQGGRIGFESEKDKGSTFWAWFPCNAYIIQKGKIEETQESHEEEKNDLLIDSTDMIIDLKILIAEDNDSNYILIKHMLKGFDLVRACNGIEVVEKAKADHYNMILMDWKMPLMDGMNATMKIREFDKTTPIIAVSANVLDSNRTAILKAGCNAFVAKPLKKQELFDVIEKFM